MKKVENILLEKFGNENYFAVPEDYFDSFAAKWSGQTAVAALPRSVQIRRVVRTWLYMAAMFAGVFLMGQFFFHSYQNQRQSNLTENYELYLFSQVADEDVFDYYLNN
ncbi:MAG: hypothetical protein LBN23_04505 [Paludibacter sp.]|nr:hypothetical protein [Paludibacter sp.]